jgi:hypothetical protein
VSDTTRTPWWQDGRVVVTAFVAFCFLVALGSLLVTIFGQQIAPDLPPPPPEVGHPISP